jgi:hypothetical protein
MSLDSLEWNIYSLWGKIAEVGYWSIEPVKLQQNAHKEFIFNPIACLLSLSFCSIELNWTGLETTKVCRLWKSLDSYIKITMILLCDESNTNLNMLSM